MVVDTSALLAILQNEPERRLFNEAIEAAEARSLSAASYVETSIVLESRYGAEGVRDLDHLIAKASDHPRACERPTGTSGTRCISKLRQGPSPGGPELRRLLLVRPLPLARPAAPLQGKGLPAHGRRVPQGKPARQRLRRPSIRSRAALDKRYGWSAVNIEQQIHGPSPMSCSRS